MSGISAASRAGSANCKDLSIRPFLTEIYAFSAKNRPFLTEKALFWVPDRLPYFPDESPTPYFQ
jgi:hypothetical protein